MRKKIRKMLKKLYSNCFDWTVKGEKKDENEIITILISKGLLEQAFPETKDFNQFNPFTFFK